MTIDVLIKQEVDDIPGIVWTPGEYPRDQRKIRESPVASWRVVVGTGISTNTDPTAIVSATIHIVLWAPDHETRAIQKEAIMRHFTQLGFSAQQPMEYEVLLPDGIPAYAADITFRGMIDTQMWYVYRQQS